MVRRGLGDGEACAFMECVSPSGRGMEVRVLVARVWVAKGCFGGGGFVGAESWSWVESRRTAPKLISFMSKVYR